jgi:hypothetical protein
VQVGNIGSTADAQLDSTPDLGARLDVRFVNAPRPASVPAGSMR